MSAPIAVAAPNALAAQAAADVVGRGGGAVDAAIAAAVAAMVSEPGVVAPGAGAFVTVLDGSVPPTVYDGYMAVPGLGGRNPRPIEHEATMAYGGGVTTVVGPGSIAVPGAWSAFGAAHERHGRLPWAVVLQPAIHLAAVGTPLGATSAMYLTDSFDPVFSHDPAGSVALAPNGQLLAPGGNVRLPGLAESLERLAETGADDFYRGELGSRIAADLWTRGSHLSRVDLDAYSAQLRAPLSIDLGSWRLASNPPPAVGGAALAAVLRRASIGDVASLVEAQRTVFAWRRGGGDTRADRTTAIEAFLADIGGDPIRCPSTAHVSTAGDGIACAITLSAGYGSGVVATGTGMWMNNGLGEVELVGDRDRLVPGTRLNSNMAPTVGRSADGRILAIGSPGADRITSALAQTLLNLESGMTAAEAIDAPRVHVDVGQRVRIAVEPGIDVPGPFSADILRYEGLHMYFGGVGVAVQFPDGRVEAATDPRRNGVALVVT